MEMPGTVGEGMDEQATIAEVVCSLDDGGEEAICNTGAVVVEESVHAWARTGSGTS
jgi:hypothetical protein